MLPFGLLIYLFRLRDLLVLCDHCIAQCYLNRTASAEKPSALTRYIYVYLVVGSSIDKDMESLLSKVVMCPLKTLGNRLYRYWVLVTRSILYLPRGARLSRWRLESKVMHAQISAAHAHERAACRLATPPAPLPLHVRSGARKVTGLATFHPSGIFSPALVVCRRCDDDGCCQRTRVAGIVYTMIGYYGACLGASFSYAGRVRAGRVRSAFVMCRRCGGAATPAAVSALAS